MLDLTNDIQSLTTHLLDIAAHAGAEEGIRQGLEDAKQARHDRLGNSSQNSKQSMAYLVSLTSRTQRDLARLNRDIDAGRSDAALLWYRGFRAFGRYCHSCLIELRGAEAQRPRGF